MELIQNEGRGAIVYLRTDMADAGDDDLEAMLQQPRRAASAATAGAQSATQRDFGVGGQILRDLGVTRMRLITNSKRDLPGLDAFGLEIADRVSI
jgi:3,4-dihydroxy 2-butanone 4-phosphate synthase/GTP cyclohydrolase II